jgi:hypothetical protein
MTHEHLQCRVGSMDEPDENTERRENCRDYQDDPYVRAACREGRCQCLDEGTEAALPQVGRRLVRIQWR